MFDKKYYSCYVNFSYWTWTQFINWHFCVAAFHNQGVNWISIPFYFFHVCSHLNIILFFCSNYYKASLYVLVITKLSPIGWTKQPICDTLICFYYSICIWYGKCKGSQTFKSWSSTFGFVPTSKLSHLLSSIGDYIAVN